MGIIDLSKTTSLLSWSGVIAAIAIPILTYFFLHENPVNARRRRWRNAVIAVSLFVAANSGFSLLRSGQIQQAFSIVQRTVARQQIYIADLRQQLSAADQAMHKQQKLIDIQGVAIGDQNAILQQQNAALVHARKMVQDAERQIQTTRQATIAIRGDANVAFHMAKVATARSHSIMQVVRETNEVTAQRLEEAQRLASDAAAKAGVYHLPDVAANQFVASLHDAQRGSATIACAPGLELACSQLGNLFRSVGWRTAIVRGASFFTGGGFDAPINSNPDAGLIVWYRPGRRLLATRLAQILNSAGLSADARADSAITGPEIGISFIFVDH